MCELKNPLSLDIRRDPGLTLRKATVSTLTVSQKNKKQKQKIHFNVKISKPYSQVVVYVENIICNKRFIHLNGQSGHFSDE